MFGSQQSRVELLDALTGLTHDIFVGDVKDNVRRKSKTSMCFQDAPPGAYKFSGQKMKFSTDLRYKTGAMATAGQIPDYVGLDAVQGELTPVRRYERFAVDNLIELLASGEGSFEDLSERIFRHLWNAWESMETRQSVGSSSGVVGLVESSTNATTFVIKDAYGHEGTDPLVNLSENSIIGWYNVSGSAVGGAATIESIDYATRTITMDNGTTWDGTAMSADDPIFFASTPNPANHHFTLERNLAPHGVGTIADPDANLTTVFGISEATYPRWKPFRKQSVTFDHLEVTEHWLQLGAKRGYDVSPETDRAITYGAPAAQLARSLMAFQQQAYTGGQLQGGYSVGGGSGNSEDYEPHAGITVAGVPIYTDGFFYHDVFLTLPKDKLYRVEVGGDADYWAGDGSRWNRIADYDGKDGFVNHYMNHLCIDRGAIGVLTEIVTELAAADFSASVPNY
jgi:hypothetical protein